MVSLSKHCVRFMHWVRCIQINVPCVTIIFFLSPRVKCEMWKLKIKTKNSTKISIWFWHLIRQLNPIGSKNQDNKDDDDDDDTDSEKTEKKPKDKTNKISSKNFNSGGNIFIVYCLFVFVVLCFFFFFSALVISFKMLKSPESKDKNKKKEKKNHHSNWLRCKCNSVSCALLVFALLLYNTQNSRVCCLCTLLLLCFVYFFFLLNSP